MKRFLAVVVTAAVAVGLYAATAGGTQQAVTPAQFNALKKQVTKMQKDVTALKSFASCIQVVPVTRFGDPTGKTTGYHYKQPDGSEITTTALDLTQQGDTPSVLLAEIDPQCISSSRLHVYRWKGQHLTH